MSANSDDLRTGADRKLITVVGSLNLDHTVRVDRLPDSGATILGHDYSTSAGGKGLNQAVAAARMGAQVSMIGAVGDDAAGSLLEGVLTEEGIETSGLRRAPLSSGTALITVSDDGGNTIVVAPGANHSLLAEDLTPEDLESSAIVLCQLEVPLDAVEAALRSAREIGAVTVLNPAPAPGPLPAEMLALVDIIVPNETEVEALRDIDEGSVGSQVDAARELIEGGVKTVIVTLGKSGAVVVDAQGETMIAPHQVDAVDPTAAGDAFIGALVAGLAEGLDVRQAARLGVAAGALATTLPGAVPSLPLRADVDRLVAS